MRVVVLRNSRSGRGLAPAMAAQACASLRAAGHDPVEVEAGSEGLREALAGAGAAVVIGGDGTVHHALADLSASGAAVYLAPTGTENLLARELGMRGLASDVGGVVGERRQVRAIDLGLARFGGAERRFAVMLSVGPDASVIHRLDAMRTGPITHASYVRPVLAELREPALPCLTVDVDARRLVTDRQGLLLIANSRQYALRIDPAAQARVDDGQLDVVFMPCRGAWGALGWHARARLRRALRHPRAVVARGVDVRIALGLGESPQACLAAQMDGEAVSVGSGPIEVSVLPGALRVFSAVAP